MPDHPPFPATAAEQALAAIDVLRARAKRQIAELAETVGRLEQLRESVERHVADQVRSHSRLATHPNTPR